MGLSDGEVYKPPDISSSSLIPSSHQKPLRDLFISLAGKKINTMSHIYYNYDGFSKLLRERNKYSQAVRIGDRTEYSGHIFEVKMLCRFVLCWRVGIEWEDT